MIRRDRAEVIVRQAAEAKCFSYKAELTVEGAAPLYEQLRDYKQVPYAEKVLDQLHAESRHRGTLPSSSTIGAMLVFSPTDGRREPISHYRDCYDNWQNREFEILPYRYALDDTAIKEFQNQYLDQIRNDLVACLGRSGRKAAKSTRTYQLTFVWGLL